MHWAWRGRDSPAPQGHGGALGSFLFFVRRMHAPHHFAWLSPRHFLPSRVSFMRAFFASCFGFVRRPAACAVGCGREAKGNDTRRGVRAKIEAGGIAPVHFMTAQPSSGPRSRQGGSHDSHLHLRPPRTQAHSHRTTTRCVTIAGTREYCWMCSAHRHS